MLNNICFAEPNQAKSPVQQSPRFFRLDSDVAVEWIYLQSLSLDIWHSDTLTCTHCQTRALQPCLPSSLSCTGQWKRVQEGPWLFCFFVCLFSFVGQTLWDFWGSAQPLSVRESRTEWGKKKKYEGTKRQKTSWLAKRSWKSWKWKNVGYLWRKNGLNVFALRSWLKERSRKVLKCLYKEKSEGPITRALYPQCIPLSCTSSTVDGSGTRDATGLRGSPPPLYNGCFTLSSPATTAEGLCLYNSGYLHWVRKPISHTDTHTHTYHLVSFISDLHISTQAETLQLLSFGTLSYSSLSLLLSYKMAVWKHHIDHHTVCVDCSFFFYVLGTLLRCLLLKCWQVFIFSAASEAISAIFKIMSSVDSCSCFLLTSSGFRFTLQARFRMFFGLTMTTRERKRDEHRSKLEFSLKTCLSLNQIAAKYHRWHCLSAH